MQERLEQYSPVECVVGQGRSQDSAIRVAPSQSEIEIVMVNEDFRGVGLYDASLWPKLGFKGPQAERWIRSQQLPVPDRVHGTERFSENGRVVRVAGDEFVVEDCPASSVLTRLTEALGVGAEGVSKCDKQEAAFLLTGERAIDVLWQTCAYDFRELEHDRMVWTRVAGASCGILPWHFQETAIFQIWVDATYARYLWVTLNSIIADLPKAESNP